MFFDIQHVRHLVLQGNQWDQIDQYIGSFIPLSINDHISIAIYNTIRIQRLLELLDLYVDPYYH
jgi:hypothetical protein